MSAFPRPRWWFLAVPLLLAASGRAPAQAINLYYRNQLSTEAATPAWQTQATAGVSAPAGPVYAPAPPQPAYPGYSGYPGYAPYPVYSPLGGALQGRAAVINAYGTYQQQVQQARQQAEAASQSRLDTERKLFDQRRYELAMTPTLEELRQLELQEAYRRALNSPPNVEVWSGLALNDLLTHAQKVQGLGLYGPAIPLTPELVRKLNFNTGTVHGGTGVIKDPSKLDWPLVLEDDSYARSRKTVEDLTARALQELAGGRVQAATLNGLNQAVADMMAQMDRTVADLTPGDFVRGKRFLKELKQAFSALEAPDARAYVDTSWTRTVQVLPQLIDAMSQRGLKFAPVAPGDEAAYTTLHQMFVSYDTILKQEVSR